MKEYLEQEVRHLNRLSEAVDNLIVSIQFSGSSVRQDALEALADLTDAFLSRHGCFPLDQTNEKERHWHRAMKRAYGIVGQPNTLNREIALSALRTTHSPSEAEVELREAAQFLADRVRELEGSINDGMAADDYYGHVVPALARIDSHLGEMK